MEILRVNGGRRLGGEMKLTAAKNAVLPMMAAALMADSPVTLTDVPDIGDIASMSRVLEALGCRVTAEERTLRLDADAAEPKAVGEALSKRLRSSVFTLGPLLARFRRAEAAYPGGCAIGRRPIDLHLSGFRALNARVTEEPGRVRVDGSGMRAGAVSLAFPSVGATENLMMTCAMLEGESRISGAAREPEIADLAGLLNAMGADVRGAGSGEIVIRGVKRLSGTRYRPIPDRITAGTLLAAAVATGGAVRLTNAVPAHMEAVLSALEAMGVRIARLPSGILAEAVGPLRAIRIETGPYPGFPTDMQAPMMALACLAEGESELRETMFENRFLHVAPLRAMGADIRVDRGAARVRGGALSGCSVSAQDLRCGAALVIAALAAEGETEIRGVELIDRGYEGLERQLRQLGADIERVKAAQPEYAVAR